MLTAVLFCIIGSSFAGDGYFYPKPSKPFLDPICPPGSNGVYPNCEDLPPPQKEQKCAPGYSGQFPDCKIDIYEPKCPEGSTGEYPTCGYLPPPPSAGCEMDWDEFKATYHKTYTDKSEENYRQQIFNQNQEIIAAHNILYEQGLETYSMCTNKFGDWVHTEYLNINGLDLSKSSGIEEQDSDESHESHYSHESHESHESYCSHESYSSNENEIDESQLETDDTEQGGMNSLSGQARANYGSGQVESNGGGVQGRTNDGSEQGRANSGNRQSNSATKSANNDQSPESKDWRNEGAVTPVKDQLECASCWAFSAVGALEGQFFLKNGILNSLSEQQLVDCTRRLGNNGCNTGFMTNAFVYTQGDGIVTEESYPYEGKDNKCRVSKTSMRNRRFKTIPRGNEAKLKEAVGNIGPIAVGLDGTPTEFQFYADGVYFNKACNPERISHAVLAIGYDFDEKTGVDYWIIKNSYGASWGQGGYGKIARNKSNHCGIANLASYPIV